MCGQNRLENLKFMYLLEFSIHHENLFVEEKPKDQKWHELINK